jgi:hypothetical protein
MAGQKFRCSEEIVTVVLRGRARTKYLGWCRPPKTAICNKRDMKLLLVGSLHVIRLTQR